MNFRMLMLGSAALLWAATGCAGEGEGDDGGSGGSSEGGQGASSTGGGAEGGSGGMLSGDACDAPAVAPSLGACALDSTTGQLAFFCNPVTNDGCSDAQSCDVSGFTNFECYDANTAGICEACDQSAMNGPFCQTGLTCYAPDPNEPQGAGTLTECARYCCNDADCAGATCTKTFMGGPWFQQAPNIGVCQN